MADGIIFRTVDMLRWGAAGGLGTGGNLSPLQFDENMWAFLTRIQALENNPPEAISILNFTVIGSQFEVNMTDGSTRGPFDLPIATFRDVGEWINDLPLLPLDFFSVINRGWYRTLIGHTTPAAPAVFDPDAIDEDSGSPTFGQKLYQLVFGEDAYIYVIGFFFPGRPGLGIEDGEPMAAHEFVHPVKFPAGLPGCVVKLKTACSADMSFPLQKNYTTNIGTVNILAGQTVGTFTFAADVSFAVADVVAVLKPTGGVDVGARALTITFNGVRIFS
jgi:hypothetical protein